MCECKWLKRDMARDGTLLGWIAAEARREAPGACVVLRCGHCKNALAGSVTDSPQRVRVDWRFGGSWLGSFTAAASVLR